MKLLQKKQSRSNDRPNDPDTTEYSSKNYNDVISGATHGMPKYRRNFSRFIHSRLVWSLSDVLGKTVARPNAILFGAITSFSLTLGVYLLSKNFGYSLSGYESIAAFFIGWVAGIIFDILSSLFKKKD